MDPKINYRALAHKALDKIPDNQDLLYLVYVYILGLLS